MWFLGLALFFATVAMLTLRTALALVSGDLATVRKLAGARSIREEAADEAAYGRTLAAANPETRAP